MSNPLDDYKTTIILSVTGQVAKKDGEFALTDDVIKLGDALAKGYELIATTVSTVTTKSYLQSTPDLVRNVFVLRAPKKPTDEGK